VDTVKKMAHSHFVSGSPLRTLCLLIAGQPADVFSVENNVNSDYGTSHQPMEVLAQLTSFSVLRCLFFTIKYRLYNSKVIETSLLPFLLSLLTTCVISDMLSCLV
jgi:hypothetical membrane protein